MARQDTIEVEATIVELLPNKIFRARLANGHELLAHGGMDPNGILPGDKIMLEVSTYDLSKGRITSRHK